MPRWILLLPLLLAGCTSTPTLKTEESKEPVKRYEIRGEIQGLDAEGKIAKVKHEQIGDWMGAMTMDFPVKDAAEFAKLKNGERIVGTVFVQGYSFWLGEVKEATTPPDASKTAK